jgi:hypothetical protein
MGVDMIVNNTMKKEKRKNRGIVAKQHSIKIEQLRIYAPHGQLL